MPYTHGPQMTGPQGEFRLLETMRVEAGGRIQLLERHLARLERSAAEFGFACELAAIRESVRAEAGQQSAPIVLRLLVSRDGAHECLYRPIPVTVPKGLRLAAGPVDSRDPFLRNKTTARSVYDRARAGLPEDEDALLFNERGEVTETTIANVAALRSGVWVTPRVECGLLGGTLRAELVESGQVAEGVIRLDELVPGELIRCFNAVRGVYDIRLL